MSFHLHHSQRPHMSVTSKFSWVHQHTLSLGPKSGRKLLGNNASASFPSGWVWFYTRLSTSCLSACVCVCAMLTIISLCCWHHWGHTTCRCTVQNVCYEILPHGFIWKCEMALEDTGLLWSQARLNSLADTQYAYISYIAHIKYPTT